MITDFELITQFKPFFKAGKSLCVTSDGYIIADDGVNLNYINCDSFNLVKTFNKEDENVTCFVANPNDYTVITANSDLLITQIDRSIKGKPPIIRKSGHSAPIFAMSLDKTSTRLVTGGADNKVRIFQIGEKEGKTYTCSHHKSKINILKNHPNRPVVVSVSMLEHEIVCWSTDNGRKLGIFEGHQNMITSLDFHAAKEIMVTSSRDRTVLVWNSANFVKQSLIPFCETIESCIFLRDNTADDIHLMVGGERGVICKVNMAERIVKIEYKKGSLFENVTKLENANDDGLKSIRNIVPMVDGGIVVIRESDNVEFYSKEMKLKYELVGQMSTLKDVVIMGEEKNVLVAVESAPYLRLFDCSNILSNETSQCTQWPSQLIAGNHSAEIMAVCVFGDGKMLVSGGKEGLVCVWRLDDNGVRLKEVASLAYENASVSSLCVDKTGSKIYVNYAHVETLALLSLEEGTLKKVCETYKPHNDLVSCIDVNIDGSMVATGSKDKLIKLWTYRKKKNQLIAKGTLKGHKRGIWSLQFSQERILLSASMDKTIKLWSLDTLEIIADMDSDNVIYKAMYSPDEKQIISCDEKGFVTVWNVDTKKNHIPVKVSDSGVLALNLMHSKDGAVLGFVAAGEDSMICLYKDVSKRVLEEAKKSREEMIQHQQEFDNLLAQNQYVCAFKLALKLNKILIGYNILSNIISTNESDMIAASPYDMSQTMPLAQVFKTLDREELKTLFSFGYKWLCNANTFLIGEQAMLFILCAVPNRELLDFELFPKHLNNILFRLAKRYDQIERNSTRLGFFLYLAGEDVLDEFMMDAA